MKLNRWILSVPEKLTEVKMPASAEYLQTVNNTQEQIDKCCLLE
jgi:hypothetical protein